MFILCLLFWACSFLYLWARIKRMRLPPLPPGPKADPLIGHVRLIDGEHQDEQFYEWGKIYGDVIYLNILGRSVIVLNSFKAANDLLDKRNANYSDRPRFVIFELMGWDKTMAFSGYGKLFQRHRKMLQHYLRVEKCVDYQPIQRREVRVLLQGLLSNYDDREKHPGRFSTAVIMQIAYGHQIQSEDDQYMVFTKGVYDIMHASGPPGATPVDVFPFLRNMPSWFPGTHYANVARRGRRYIDALHDVPFEDVQRQMAQGSAETSFTSHYLDAQMTEESSGEFTLADIKGAAGNMYGAGAETTWSTLSTFIFAMLYHPDCQARAQKEIDSVIGSGRLPDYSDMSSLPYVEGIFQETLRWHNAVPLGVPHRSFKDDIYRGMFIPGGSTIIANTRAMNLDESIYSDPRKFNPSRYLPRPEGNGEPQPSKHEAFGFGRRICPGRHLAESGVWLAIASILCVFDILPGEDGLKYERDVKFPVGLTSKPPPYKCRMLPRSATALSLIVDSDT